MAGDMERVRGGECVAAMSNRPQQRGFHTERAQVRGVLLCFEAPSRRGPTLPKSPLNRASTSSARRCAAPRASRSHAGSVLEASSCPEGKVTQHRTAHPVRTCCVGRAWKNSQSLRVLRRNWSADLNKQRWIAPSPAGGCSKRRMTRRCAARRGAAAARPRAAAAAAAVGLGAAAAVAIRPQSWRTAGRGRRRRRAACAGCCCSCGGGERRHCAYSVTSSA